MAALPHLRVELFTDDVPALVAFLVEVLRFEVEGDPAPDADYVAVRRGSVRVGVGTAWSSVDPTHRHVPTGVELVLEVDDLDAEVAHLEATGWPLAEPVQDRPWGLRDVRVHDPAGHYWRLTHR
jgi:lactoylglutathione lyase